ncbi:hypothetical protein D3C71_2090800 [compost metagenome]
MVGTSGSVGVRVAPVVPSAASFPAFTLGAASPTLANTPCTSPLNRPPSASDVFL